MAKINTASLTYTADNTWVYFKAITDVEFEQRELNTMWFFQFALKESDIGPDDE